MTRQTHPLRLPASIKAAAQRMARADGVSLDQWIALAVAQKVSATETADSFFAQRAGDAKPADLLGLLARVPDRPPMRGDALKPRRGG